VVELLEPTLGARGRRRGEELVNAAKLVELLGVSRDYVYDHADELGAIRLSGRDRARLRFHPDTAKAALAAASQRPHQSSDSPPREPRRPRRPDSRSPMPLLPVRGEPTR
jgi:hypothetical protein